MIKCKKDLEQYLNLDKYALGIRYRRPKLFRDEIWRFQILLRKTEYAFNCLNHPFYLPYKLFLKLRFHRLSVRLGYTIPLNVFGKGLSIAHYGSITINSNAKIGDYCRIQEGVTIGSTNGTNEAPIVGDYVFIGSGAKLIGNIKIAKGVAIGAGSVVVKSILTENVTVAGIPAKQVSSTGSKAFINLNLS